MTACAGNPGYLPRFQPQNPALSGDKYGWVDCLAFSAGMAGDFDTCGAVKLTGTSVRQLSSEPVPDRSSPGLSLRQIDDAMNRYGVDLEVQYRLPWDDFVRKIEKGEGAVLQGATGPFVGTKWQATAGDINHGIFVPPGWGAMDPCADGRRAGVHKYDGSPYPKDLLRAFAGHLVLDVVNGHPNRLGAGFVFAAFTRDRRATWTWHFDPPRTSTLHIFDVSNRVIVRHEKHRSAGTRAYHSGPPQLLRWPGHTSQSLVQLGQLVAGGDGAYTGQYAHARYATEVP